MPQKVKNKITGQLHACLHVSLQSPINPLCSTTPLLPSPLFSAPFSSAALLSSRCHRYRCCWCCPHCTRSPRCCCCCCCCCVPCLCLHQLMVRAALVRDLVLRTSCPSCSSVSCWDALTCSKALKLPPPWPLRLLPTQLPPHPHQGVALGGGGPGGGAGGGPGGVSLITGSDQKRYINKSRVNPAG